ncbi:MAG: SapC family protein [Desulfobacteraceae bacterium]|nr:SapC family protein [Desulfobacteraceae bacterium]
MPQLSAISPKNHADKTWTRFSSYHFASKSSIASLVGAEIAHAVAAGLPLAFVKEQDRFFLAAVLSLAPGTNLFVAQNGKWLGEYIPSVFRSYPFMLAKAEGKDDLILCVDEESGLIKNDKNGEAFFDDQGELSRQVHDIFNFLSQIEKNKVQTARAVAALTDAGVITQWPLKIKHGDQEKPVTGLYRIDEAKLNSLDDEQFLKIRKAGALPIAYAQLLSMGNVQVFEKLAKAQEQAAVKTPDAGSFLGDDDVISFQ